MKAALTDFMVIKVFLLFLYTTVSYSAPSPANQDLSLGISQIVEHPSLDEIRRGLIETLQKEDFSPKKLKINYLNAQGDMITSAQIGRKLAGDQPDVLVGLSTPSTQGLIATKTRIPIVFSGVNDPIAAKLLKNLDKPEANVTGVMLVSPVKEQIELMLEVIPQAKKFAIIYNSGEANSVAIAEQFKEEVKKVQREAILVSINKSSQVQAAAQSLVGRADGVYLPTDNTVISALGAILQIATQGRLPIFTADNASVAQGALASLGLDHYEMGVVTGKVVAQILRGEKIANIPVARPQTNELHINLKYAKQMGIELPSLTLKKAHKIYR